MDIKVLFRAPAFPSQSEKDTFTIGKVNISNQNFEKYETWDELKIENRIFILSASYS